jgi:hypothetical protein
MPEFYRSLRRPLEHALVAGRPIAAPSGPSVLFFTAHKCASTLMPRIFGYLSERHGGCRVVDLEGYLWGFTDQPLPDTLIARAAELFRPQGLAYVPLRRFYPVPELERFRLLLMLRDPRDMLVSHYYSLAYSHAPPAAALRQAAFAEARGRSRAMSIDEYCLRSVDAWEAELAEYRTRLLERHDVALLRYEDLVLDPERWLADLAAALRLELDGADIAALLRIAEVGRPGSDDQRDHIRRKLPGEHRQKLRRATIRQLDRRLGPLLESFGYAG